MKQLKPTNLIAVEVPEDAFDIKKMDNYSMSFRHNKDYEGDVEFSSVVVLHHQDYKSGNNVRYLGEVTKNGVQFDVEPYIDKLRWAKPYNNLFSIVGVNKEESVWWTDNPKESFQSLLQANNVEIPKRMKLLILLKQ